MHAAPTCVIVRVSPLPHHPPVTRKKGVLTSPSTLHTRHDWCLVSPLLCAHQGSWNCVGAARHLQHCGQQQGTLSSPLQSADLRLQHYSLYSYRAITEGERLLQCCTACSYLSIFSLHCSISPSSIHRLQYCSTSISEPSLNHSQCPHSRGSQAAADG